VPRPLNAVTAVTAAALASLAAVSAARAQPAPADPPAPAVDPATDPAASPATPPPVDPGSTGVPPPRGVAMAGDPLELEDEAGIGDQGIAAAVGLAAGGRSTPGGLRVAGHYLYQLSSRDWFDGTASFTFGGGGTACFRDRADQLVCEHGLADGAGVEISASVRRMFAPRGAFQPFGRLGVGLGLVRFADDDVAGVTVPAHGGAGVRVDVAPAIAVVVDADLTLGFGSFTRQLGTELQFGFAVTAGVEFRLR
jgi:opacity protein-like surface antigen